MTKQYTTCPKFKERNRLIRLDGKSGFYSVKQLEEKWSLKHNAIYTILKSAETPIRIQEIMVNKIAGRVQLMRRLGLTIRAIASILNRSHYCVHSHLNRHTTHKPTLLVHVNNDCLSLDNETIKSGDYKLTPLDDNTCVLKTWNKNFTMEYDSLMLNIHVIGVVD